MFIQLPTGNLTNVWVFYTLSNPARGIFHADIVRFTELTALDGLTLPADVVYLQVVETNQDLQVLYNQANVWLAEKSLPAEFQWKLRDHIAKLTSKAHGNAKAVICETTGETFASANAAAKAHKVSYVQLLNHLNGQISYKSVKGKKYRWK